MQRSTDRILTTHAGRLSLTAELDTARRTLPDAEAPESRDTYLARVGPATAELVRRQRELGVDVIGDGELGKFNGHVYYGRRMTGLATRPLAPGEPPIWSARTNERIEFAEFYEQDGGRAGRAMPAATERLVAEGPIAYQGEADVADDIARFRQALGGVEDGDAFMCVLAPGWIEHQLWNEYYPDDEGFLYAIAGAMKHEYRAIVDAGFILQLDDPGLPDSYDMIVPLPSIEEYREFANLRVEALNHALEGIPEDRVRYHICWGSWHGPHTHDIELRHVVDLMLKVNAGAYSVEAANPRHEHEWKVWQETRLPDGKILIPGVVSHASNVVEHPELVADRIVTYANLVGREHVIAGTDCGLGGRVHPQIQWAKLRALVDGAALATERLWGAGAAATRSATPGRAPSA